MKKTKNKLDLTALASIPLMMTLANSMLIPILPAIQQQLGISPVQSSLIITVYAAVSIVCIPVAGYLSDRFGRKKIILFGLAIVTVGGAAAGASAWLLSGGGAYAGILAGRFVQGIGAAGAFPIVIPLVGDMFKSEKEVSSGLGLIETSNTFGKVLSPVLGSALALVLWFLPLAVIPAISAASFAAVLFLVKAPEQAEAKADIKSFLRALKTVLAQNGKWLYAVFAIGGGAMFIMFGFLYYLSSVMEETYHIHGVKKGGLLAIPLLAICLSSFAAGKLVGENKTKMKWFTVAGAALTAAAMLVSGLADTKKLFMLIVLVFIGGAGIGFTLPGLDALITEGIQKEQRGSITSLYSSMRFIGVAAGPLIASLLLKQTDWMFYLYTGIALACCLIALFFIKPDKGDRGGAKEGA